MADFILCYRIQRQDEILNWIVFLSLKKKFQLKFKSVIQNNELSYTSKDQFLYHLGRKKQSKALNWSKIRTKNVICMLEVRIDALKVNITKECTSSYVHLWWKKMILKKKLTEKQCWHHNIWFWISRLHFNTIFSWPNVNATEKRCLLFYH